MENGDDDSEKGGTTRGRVEELVRIGDDEKLLDQDQDEVDLLQAD